jgi:hypothetical protein
MNKFHQQQNYELEDPVLFHHHLLIQSYYIIVT